jgi:hypothetical protein
MVKVQSETAVRKPAAVSHAPRPVMPVFALNANSPVTARSARSVVARREAQIRSTDQEQCATCRERNHHPGPHFP